MFLIVYAMKERQFGKILGHSFLLVIPSSKLTVPKIYHFNLQFTYSISIQSGPGSGSFPKAEVID